MTLAVGAGVVVLSYALDPKYRDRLRVFRRRGEAAGPGRHTRWRSRLLGPDASLGATATVALGAGLVEAASMLPYLAAIGTITALQLPTAARGRSASSVSSSCSTASRSSSGASDEVSLRWRGGRLPPRRRNAR